MSVNRLAHIIIAFFLMVSPLSAAVVCVGPSATGDESGKDWSNLKAITALTGSNWTRGNTYYLKEGTYGKVTFTTAASGATYIFIKKCGATDTACTTLAGYDAADHDGQAVFSATGGSGREWTWGITTNYWDFDGITGGYPNWTTGHGIKVTTDNPQATLAIIYPNTPTGIRMQHIEFAHVGRTYNSTSHADAQSIKMYDNAGAGGGGSHYFAYNYFHDNPTGVFWTRLIGAATFELNYMDTNASGVDDEVATSIQGAGMTLYCADDYVIDRNIFKNIEGSRIIALYAGHEAGTMCAGVSAIDDVKIYNNVFFWEASLAGDSTSDTDHLPELDGYSMFLQDGYIGGESGVTLTNVKIYSNTFSNLDAYRVVYAAAGTDGNEFKNNIVYNCEGNTTASGNFSGFTHTNNWYYGANAYNSSTDLTADWAAESNSVTGTGSPFTDISTEDFSLAAGATAINAGADLGASYNTDILAIARPQGAAWDIGAYERTTGGGTTYTVTPSATNCTISPAVDQETDGTAVEFTMIGAYGYTASAGGTCGGTLSSGTYTTSAITADCTVTCTGLPKRGVLGGTGTVSLGGSGVACLSDLIALSYDGNESTSGTVPNTSLYCAGQTVTVLGNTGTIARTGYDFDGWNTAADGSGTSYSATDTFAISVATTLYAKWAVHVFSPSDISGLLAWYAADEIDGLNDGDPVGTWSDLSGNGHHFSQATAGYKPLYKTNQVNGLPALHFDGNDGPTYNDDRMTTVDVVSPIRTVIVVARYYREASANFASYSGLITGTTADCWFIGNSGTDDWYTFESTGLTWYKDGSESNTEVTNAWHIFAATANSNRTFTVMLGYDRNNSGRTWGGEVAEIIIYNSVISGDDFTNLHAYLKAKYGTP